MSTNSVLKPADETELAEVVKSSTGPLCITGGGTRGLRVEGQELSTRAMTGITLYEPGALTMVAKAGTPLSEIEAALDSENQMLAFEPFDLKPITGLGDETTIGGVFATNASGPRRIQAGAARDFLLGVRFVDGRGDIIKNGGRVMKNVTGYDLVKLMAGSCGTIGVVSEVSFKVLPKPETCKTIIMRGLSDEAACIAMRAGVASPFDITGAAHDPGQGSDPVTLIRIEGFAGSVSYRAGQLDTLLSRWTDEIAESDECIDWDVVRGGGSILGEGDIWRISVKPTDGPLTAARLNALAHVYDWGGGLIWARVPEGTDVRAQLDGIAGHATLVRGKCQPRFQPEPSPIVHLSAGLRAQFDPRGILNAGLMG
jgi:glycolate oxidase FAD binding subunit